MKVIHIVEHLENQSVENWLLRMLKHAAASDMSLDWTFYSVLGGEAALDETARRLGARVVHSPCTISDKRRFMAALRGELRAGGYDVLHCHHDVMSAPYLLASAGLPIGRRIVHVHNADMNLLTHSRIKKFLLAEPFRRICLTADRVVGVSNHVLGTMLGGRPRRPGRDQVHYLGIDTARFESVKADRDAFRRTLSLPANTPILLFAGRMAPEKNPVYAVDVLASLRRHRPDVAGVFAGTGGLEEAVKQRAAELGQTEATRFLGWRADVPDIMAASDWFILPHPEEPMEGFGLAVVEAQLAGLRLLLSRGVADDPLLPTARYRRLGLGEGADAWAAAAMELMDGPAPSVPDACAALRASPMDMDFALADLMRLHQ